jgi:serine/threonine-protein kinase
VTEAGSSVVLTIASGDVTVPNLIGIEAIQAKTILIQAGFLIKEFYDYDAAQPEGVVIRQAPDSGMAQTIGNSVTITINRKP